jgi:hypothetical protein
MLMLRERGPKKPDSTEAYMIEMKIEEETRRIDEEKRSKAADEKCRENQRRVGWCI